MAFLALWSESCLCAITVSAHGKAAKLPTHSQDEFAKRSLISFWPSAFVLSRKSMGVCISYCIYLGFICWKLVLAFASVSPVDLTFQVCFWKSYRLRTGLWVCFRSLGVPGKKKKLCSTHCNRSTTTLEKQLWNINAKCHNTVFQLKVLFKKLYLKKSA